MDISIKQIRELIRQGEGISVEFKTCRNKINRDVYETVCAFLNRHGGTILLGVQDDGTLQGIEPDAVTHRGADPQLIERGCFSHDHQCAGIWRKNVKHSWT